MDVHNTSFTCKNQLDDPSPKFKLSTIECWVKVHWHNLSIDAAKLPLLRANGLGGYPLAICGELSDGTPGTRPNAVSVFLREALLPTQLLALAIAVIIYSITSIYHSMSFLARLHAKGT